MKQMIVAVFAGLVVFAVIIGLALFVYGGVMLKRETVVHEDYTVTLYNGTVIEVKLPVTFTDLHPDMGCDTADFADPNGHYCVLLGRDTIGEFFSVLAGS